MTQKKKLQKEWLSLMVKAIRTPTMKQGEMFIVASVAK
jgi:hypothetical protein